MRSGTIRVNGKVYYQTELQTHVWDAMSFLRASAEKAEAERDELRARLDESEALCDKYTSAMLDLNAANERVRELEGALRGLAGWSSLAKVIDPTLAEVINKDIAWTEARAALAKLDAAKKERDNK